MAEGFTYELWVRGKLHSTHLSYDGAFEFAICLGHVDFDIRRESTL